MTRVGADTVVALKADLDVSSSEFVAISTSLRSDDRKDGSPFVSLSALDGGDPLRLPFGWRLELAIEGDVEEEPGLSMTRRVRGRFSFRSGSAGVSLSAGEAVTDLDFLFRLLGLVVSISFAFSSAPHAIVSSGVSTGGCGAWARSLGGAAWRNTSRAPCLPAIFNRVCHCRNSRLSSAVRR